MGVRRESVELSLADAGFTSGMAKAAAQTAALNRELKSLDGTSVRAGRSTKTVGDEGEKTGQKMRRASGDLDRFTGRLNLLATAGATLGPALLPIGAVAVPGVTALAGGLGAAAGAVGTAMLAFHGLGDALKALNDYQLDPTNEHLKKLQETFGQLSPAAQDLVTRLDGLEPVLDRLRNTAQAGMFPGLNEGLDQMLALVPEVNTVIGSLATEMGRLASDAGGALKNDADWQAFFHFIETDAAPTLDAFARATGNVIAGLGSILVAFRPLSNEFTGGMLDMSRSFRDWAANLGENGGFQHFIEYIQENGPAVRDFFAAVGQALVALAQAAAPWGAAILPILTDVAKVFAAIAGSPLGPTLYGAAAAMLAFNRASMLFGGAGLPKVTGGIAAIRTATSGLTGDLGIMAASWLTAGATTEREAARMAAARQRLGATLGGAGLAVGTKVGIGAVAAYAGGTAVQAGFDKIGGNVNAVGESLLNGDRAWYTHPVPGFHPSHNGDKAPVEKADANLAQAVGAGQSTEAAKQFKKYADAANMSVKEAEKHFPLYTAAVSGASQATDTLGTSTITAAGQMHAVAVQSEDARKQLEEQRKAARQTGESFTAFGSSLDDSKVSLSSWIKSMADQASALRDFTKNAQTAAKRGLRDGLIKELEAAGPAGALRLKQLANASDAEIGRANKAWSAGRKAIRDYVNMKVPPKKVDVDSNGAISAIEALQARINALHGTTITNVVDMVQRGFDSKRAGMKPSADGSTVPKDGGSYADRYHYLLAPGEEVISNRYGQADRFRPLLKAINAGRLADGGTVGRATRIAGEFGVDIDKDDHLKKQLRLFEVALGKATSALSNETSARESLMGTITGNLTSDLFSSKGSVFSSKYAAGSVGAANATLTQDIHNADEQSALERQLRLRGLSGAALQEVIAQGGINGLRSFASASNTELKTYQSLYGQRATAVSHAASAGASAVGMTAEITKLRGDVKAITAALNREKREQKRRAAAAHKSRQAAAATTGAQIRHSTKNAAKKRR